ncbi:hypothetical protein, partial [Providencia stuartii]|uniref:hypothetical protein n=1 Tax=Providencia stuartii TaxID=588 RepID=UPI001954C838
WPQSSIALAMGSVSGGQVFLNVVEGMSRIADVVNQSSTSITALGQSSDEIPQHHPGDQGAARVSD